MNQKLWSDLRRRRASGFNLGERTEPERADAKPNPRANKFSPPRMLFVGPNSAPNSGRISAHRSLGGTGGSNPPRSAIESFSVCNSATDDRNTRLRGRFRIAGGSGERSEPRIQSICGSFYRINQIRDPDENRPATRNSAIADDQSRRRSFPERDPVISRSSTKMSSSENSTIVR